MIPYVLCRRLVQSGCARRILSQHTSEFIAKIAVKSHALSVIDPSRKVFWKEWSKLMQNCIVFEVIAGLFIHCTTPTLDV